MPSTTVVSNSPTLEYRRRHAVEPPVIDERAFKPFWRRIDRIEKLRASGAINQREFQAAINFRRTYERAYSGPGGLRAGNMDAIYVDKDCRWPMPEMLPSQAGALAWLARIKAVLGPGVYNLIELTIVFETSWREVARRRRLDRRTARSRCLAAIAALVVVV
jgi:hypothetical protein